MYLQRSIDSQLLDWKNSIERKPLLLRGARQVGKSSAVRHLALSFQHFIEINFEKQPELRDLFASVRDVHELTHRLAIIYKTPVVPGQTLIFLDEIQASPDAIKSLWFFKEDFPDLHVIAAGSLLEFALKDLSSFGVGRVRSFFMYPFSFDEFLVAQDLSSWVDEKRNADGEHPLFDLLHNNLVQQFRTFLIVGGMPASVARWVSTHDYQLCQEEQDDIQTSYYDDFAKYAKKIDPMLLRNTLHSVISQMGNKFVYNKVDGGFKSNEVKLALSMLCDAGIIKRVSHTAANGLPLGAQVNDKFRKYIFLDSGLLLRVLDMNFGGAQQITEMVLAGAASELVNKGSLAEMFLGLEMVKYANARTTHELYYWENLSKGTSSEVDYVFAKNMQVVPIECKAGVIGKMKSLRLFMRQKHLREAYRCSLENFSNFTFIDKLEGDQEVTRHINIVPLYAISNLIS